MLLQKSSSPPPSPSSMTIKMKQQQQRNSFSINHMNQLPNSLMLVNQNDLETTIPSSYNHQFNDNLFRQQSLAATTITGLPSYHQQTSSIFMGTKLSNFSQSPTNFILPDHRRILHEYRSRALSRSKLKQSSQVSALLSGFALVAMVELDIDDSGAIPLPILIFFITTTTLLVSVHMMALMISTCILPHIESLNAIEDLAISLEQGENISDPQKQQSQQQQHSPSKPDYWDVEAMAVGSNASSVGGFYQNIHQTLVSLYGSPHKQLRHYISIAWFFSTVIGIFLFILELVAIVWVKFWNQWTTTSTADGSTKVPTTNNGQILATISTFLLLPVLAALMFFAFHFYRKLVMFRCERVEKEIDELNVIADKLSC